ncbi:murein transglycosylase [Ureibacillus aquaedulcis]|uniref:Murein transglycosylase n=1 Tax=Ureibacillus aquaedulcis TaxID=3058421 RepID=A0ABT8GSH7_9BACL|nr:murein transglycosylase [Ureibacillus sp. BA0131]MDN4494358.1 murein transglycosylase [Ureibacillus sp. BA0131]
MRKLLIVLLAVPVFFLLIIGLVLFDYIYFPLISSKAEAAAERYLEKKYEEEFIIDESSFSKPLGDDMGTYRIDSHPSKNPKLTVRITVDEDMEPVSDNYLDMKWREELNKLFGPVYKELYGSAEKYSFMVNVSFPPKAYVKYNISNNYKEILKEDHEGIGNIIFANVLLTPSKNMKLQLEKAYNLIQYLKKQELEYFTINIDYFNEKLENEISENDKSLDYSSFLNKHLQNRDYVFNFSYDSRYEGDKQKLEDIKSAKDLEQYLRSL